MDVYNSFFDVNALTNRAKLKKLLKRYNKD